MRIEASIQKENFQHLHKCRPWLEKGCQSHVYESAPISEEAEGTTTTELVGSDTNDDPNPIPVKRRGRSRCVSLERLGPGEKVLVDIKNGEAVGPNHQRFASFLGVVVRSHIPLSIQDWRKVPNDLKEGIIRELATAFSWERCSKNDNDILSHAGDLYRRYRDYLKRKYFSGKELPVVRANVPDDVDPNEWQALVDYWTTPRAQEESKRNKENREKGLELTHCLGRESIMQLKHKFEKRVGREPNRMEIFEMTKSKDKDDGSKDWAHDDYKKQHKNMSNLVQGRTSDNEEEGAFDPLTPEEAFVRVMGREHPGRVRCAGRRVTIGSWSKDGGSSQVGNDILERMTRQENEINELKASNKRMEEVNKRMEEMMKQLAAQVASQAPQPPSPPDSHDDDQIP